MRGIEEKVIPTDVPLFGVRAGVPDLEGKGSQRVA